MINLLAKRSVDELQKSTSTAKADALFELSYLLIAEAGWSESDWQPTASPTDVILFFA